MHLNQTTTTLAPVHLQCTVLDVGMPDGVPKGAGPSNNKRAGTSSADVDLGTDASLSRFSLNSDDSDSASGNETDGSGKISDSSC